MRAFVEAGPGKLWLLLVASLGAACEGVIPPDPYQGTIDPNSPAPGGPFDPLVAFQASSNNPLAACLQPRKGFGGQTGLDTLRWVYLGGLSATQLDISNASDPAKALPPSVYQVRGCNAPEGRGDPLAFDPRLDNYLRDRQYPVVAQGLVPALAGAASEPTRLSTYKPWHVVVPVDLQPSVADRMGCNDIKGERSLLERAGWSRETKTFPDGGPRDFDIHFPSRDAIRAGMVTFKDWPMVNVAVPVMNTPVGVDSCPFVNGSKARYPSYPGDPQASFQFPAQHWLRGLLGGYLDGGDVPVTTDPTQCPALVQTVKDCSLPMTPCTGVGEVCSNSTAPGKCMAPVPVCPVVNDLYVPVDEVPVPSTNSVANPIPSPTVTLKDPSDMTRSRTADIMAVFAATPGQAGFSPVCRLRFFDKKKLSCGRAEVESIAPRPLCTADEIKNTAGAVLPTSRDYYVHCLFLQPQAR